MEKILMLDNKNTDAIYTRWEGYREFPVESCLKFLIDDIAKGVWDLLDKTQVVLIHGAFRTGKSTLLHYMGKKLELESKKVEYIDLSDRIIGKYIYDEDADMLHVDDFNIGHVVENYDILFFDQLCSNIEFNWSTIMKISEAMVRRGKKVCFFMHPEVFYGEKGMEYARDIYALGNVHDFFLFGYTVENEKKILEKLGVGDEVRKWCLENLHGSRILYNMLMARIIEEGDKLEEVIESFKRGIIHRSLFRGKIGAAMKKYIDGKAKKDDEFLLLCYGILSRQGKKTYLPTPYKLAYERMKQS